MEVCILDAVEEVSRSHPGGSVSPLVLAANRTVPVALL